MNTTQPAGPSARALGALATSAVLLSCPPALALNPSLELRQYGHSAQLLGAGFVRGIIRAITQTPDGYLWLGTDQGVFRFDGVRAVAWTPPPGHRLPSTLGPALSPDATARSGSERLRGW